MEWFKFYGGAYLSDPKMLMLTACERSCWVTLLSFASVAEDGGRIRFLTEPQLMTAANLSPMHEEWDLTVGVLNKFEELGMITQSNGDITVLNWGKRQESYLTNAERQRRFREKHKSNAKVTEVLQNSNARIEENRIDNTGVAIAPQVVETPDNEEEKVSAKKNKYPDADKVFVLWGDYPRTWIKNPNQRAAAQDLFEKRKIEGIKNALDWYADLKDRDFCPQIDSPYDLDSKWAKFEKFVEKQEV